MTDDLAIPMSARTNPGAAGRWRLHVLLAVQSLVVVLVSLNRLGSWTEGYVAPNQFLRWVDLGNVVLALVSLVAFYLLKRHVEAGAVSGLGLGVTFVVGAFLLAASYGDHETTNYLHVRFCPDAAAGRLCDIIAYHDDSFSHLMFFAGFTIINLVIMLTQVRHPDPHPSGRWDTVLITFNALFIGAGIVANLAFEAIGLDLYVVAVIAALALGLLLLRPRQPILQYYAIAYIVGLVGTALIKLT